MRAFIAVLLVLVLLVAPGCGKETEADGGAAPSPFDPQTSTPSPFAPPSTTSPTTTPPATAPPLPTFTPSGNQPPVVTGITLTPAGSSIAKSAAVTLNCAASDPDGDSLTYKWAATGGSFDSTDAARAVWRAPELTGSFVVTVTVTDGKGGTTTSQQSFTVVANGAPAISSLVASPTSIGPGGRVTVTGAASDPDGDTLTYKWTADGGAITGVGTNVTWQAPDAKPGEKSDYAISLTVEDGRGGQDIETVHVTITFGYGTKQYSTVAADTGTAIKDGGVDMSVLRAGDTVDDEAMRAFVSFNLADLHSTDVTEATVTFTHLETVGEPFKLPTGLRGVRVFVVRYESGGLPEFNTQPLEELTKEPLFASPTTFDVTKFVQRIGENMAASDQLQFMLTLQRDTNNDQTADYMAWSKVSLTVTFAPD